MGSGRLISFRDPVAAVLLLTRIPLPADHAAIGARLSASAWAWPLVGAAVGGICGAVGLGALGIGLAPGIAAALALLTGALLTGGLHEDGLCDCADGFWGGASRERRLEIMKDSRIGAHAGLALILVTLIRWTALAALPGPMAFAALIAAGALSRAGMALVMAALPNARAGGLSAGVGRPGPGAVVIGTGLAMLVAGLACGAALPVLALVALVASLGIAALARARIGGQTGDVLGAAQVVAETGVLAAATITMM